MKEEKRIKTESQRIEKQFAMIAWNLETIVRVKLDNGWLIERLETKEQWRIKNQVVFSMSHDVKVECTQNETYTVGEDARNGRDTSAVCVDSREITRRLVVLNGTYSTFRETIGDSIGSGIL